jgi:hypothetical protein
MPYEQKLEERKITFPHINIGILKIITLYYLLLFVVGFRDSACKLK